MQRRPGMPEIGPLGTFKMVTGSSLPHLIRQLVLHCDIMCQIWLDCVGLETHGGRTTKFEYKSNWRRRLEQIRMLKKRILDAKRGGSEGGAEAGVGGAGGGTENGEEGSRAEDRRPAIDLEEAERARLFTSWLT